APKINLITSMRGRCFSSTYFYVRFSLCSSYLRVYVRNISSVSMSHVRKLLQVILREYYPYKYGKACSSLPLFSFPTFHQRRKEAP
ncbi:MAG: hypothetical protein ACK53Y_06185, partial [bacterium]